MNAPQDFWSRRKAGVLAEREAEHAEAEARDLQSELAEREAKEDAEILAELNLPDPDQLQLGDDVRAFMEQAVPDRLRRRALRRLWRMNPVLANVDGLIEYGEDFTDSATVIENLQTTYQVGKGMLAHIEELARQAEEDHAETEAEPEEIAAELAPECDEIQVAFSAETDASQDAPEEETIEIAYDTRPRRMQFAFDEDATT